MKGHVSHGTVVIFACFCEIGRGTSRLEKPPPTNQTSQPCRNPGINDRFGIGERTFGPQAGPAPEEPQPKQPWGLVPTGLDTASAPAGTRS